MNFDEAKDALKSRLKDYLKSKGIEAEKNKPFTCLTGTHTDSNPSMFYDKDRNKVHCFSCMADMDIIDLIKIDYNITDTAEAFKKGYELYNIKLDQKDTKNEQNTHNTDNKQYTHNTHNTDKSKDISAYLEKCRHAYKKTSYLKDRGISDKTAELYNIGYDSNFYFVNKEGGFNAPAIIIPTQEDSYNARCTDDTKPIRYNKRGAVKMFNESAIKDNDIIFVVEGEIDALSVIEAGSKNVIAIGSTSQANSFLNYVIDNKLQNTFILILDNEGEEGAGQKATKVIAEGFNNNSIKYTTPDIYKQYKDANEMLRGDKEGLITSLKDALKYAENIELNEYSKNYTKAYYKDFLNGIKESVNTQFIPTGFKGLDEVLDGGLFEGLYIIGAVSSLGKTTFTLQLADQVAGTGQDVIIFSLEMARNELIAKSISRLTMLNCENKVGNAKTTRGITTYNRYFNYSEAEKELIQKSIIEYFSKQGEHIIIHEGQGNITADDIRAQVEKHIRITGNRPVVIVDYLQIIAPYNERATDKQNTDKAVSELKRISRDNKISVIAVSSFNRENYNAKVSMKSFKESGAIEYSSDVLIGLQFKGAEKDNFDVDEAKKKSNSQNSPREIELKILKNRNGRTGDTIEYKYYPLFNYFLEGKIQG